jgi:hypothetical protein
MKVDEVGEMLFQLFMVVVMKALDGRFLDRSVHSLDLPIGPWVLHLCQAMFDIVLVTDPVEDVMAKERPCSVPFLVERKRRLSGDEAARLASATSYWRHR